ncbi:MAG: hypothetical protein ACJ75Z_13260 [Solirubrobacterales bacterium]
MAGLVCVLTLVGMSSARASVTIGQLPETTPTPSCPITPTDYLQPSVTSGELYIAREAGTIVSWSTRASIDPGQEFVPKVFRRTADPDVFQVVEHSPQVTLVAGLLNTFPVSLPVRSGDMLGFNAGGAVSACTSDVPGDRVLTRLGDLADGQPGTFAPKADSRLNLSAVLVPSNDFTVTVKPDHQGKAAVTVFTSNPGVVSLSGKGLRSGRAAKSVFVAGPVHFQVTAAGRSSRRLARRGRVSIRATVTFAPTSGEPRSQQITVRLRKRRTLGVL